MEDPDLAPEETTHSSRVKAGITRAKARGRRWGRPTVTEKKMDPDLAVKVFEMRAQGLPWSEVAIRLDVSESTARRLLSTFEGDCEGRDTYSVKKTCF
ncbi:MAG: recombinase family protein [Methanomassiliicoccales archaeon]|nr:MAG: recombinase family protein [Methanomassiliicoccales archaeon]